MNLRAFFSRHGVFFADSGKNVSRGNLSLRCPWCGASDPSQHLAINETTNEFYCYRNPTHKGRNLPKLFKALGIPYSAYKDEVFTVGVPDYKPKDRDYAEFQYFEPAQESKEALNYLESRLFSRPVDICKKFNLKVSKQGKWAGRLIIPLNVGWTGRAMRSHLSPRYLSHTNESGLFIHGSSSSVLLVEGPLDALRCASVTSEFMVIATLGQRISPTLAYILRERNVFSVYYIPDTDVPFPQSFDNLIRLRSYCTIANVNSVDLPSGYKDIAEMPEDEARNWIRLCSQQVVEVERKLDGVLK